MSKAIKATSKKKEVLHVNDHVFNEKKQLALSP